MKGAYKNMKFNQKQNESLEEIYRIARIYTEIAAKLNELADDIKTEDGSLKANVFTEQYVERYVAMSVRHLENRIQLRAKDLEKDTKDGLNDLKKAFLKTES